METCPRLDNLLAVPSFHYEPIFAREVRRAFADFRPTVVALEYPAELGDEVAWALSCWPAPVCSRQGRSFWPFVPGDSMVEAYRLAHAAKVPVHFVDLSIDRPERAPGPSLPGPEFAPSLGALYAETVDEILRAAGPPLPVDLSRESFMASHLARLMATHERVLWVGGMGHWPRMRALLAAGRLPPPKATKRRPHFTRLALSANALFEATRRTPYLAHRYVTDPDRYEENEALRALALDAVEEHPDRDVALVRSGRPVGEREWSPESCSPADVARVLTYAHNLQRTRSLGDRPTLMDLLDAASAVIGDRYAGRLFALATEEHDSEASRALPRLTYRSTDRRSGYRLAERWVDLRPHHGELGSHGVGAISVEKVRSRAAEFINEDLPPARADEDVNGKGHPTEVAVYENFVAHLFRKAEAAGESPERSAAFDSGMRDGIDARETLRHWREGRVFVRERSPARIEVLDLIVDYTSSREDSDDLRGCDGRGWSDPQPDSMRSASRIVRNEEVQKHPYRVLRMRRGFSYIMRPRPGWIGRQNSHHISNEVINPLVWLEETDRDHLYSWLDVIFRACRRRPIVYFSAYRPGPKIRRLAAAHLVRLMHIPLSQIPAAMIEPNRSFHLLELTPTQYDALRKRVGGRKG